MKKLFLKSVFILIFSIAFLGCSSDNSDDCQPITCLNGGISNSDCGCDCPQGFSGNNCSTEISPSKITITKIWINKFPNNGGGIDDLGTNPDLFISLNKSSNNVYVASSYFNEAQGDGSQNYEFVLPTNIDSNSISTIFTLYFWDYDNTTENDIMNSIPFSPYTSIQGLGFPDSFIIQDLSGQYKAKIFVTYQW